MKLSCNIEGHLWSICYQSDNYEVDILRELFNKWTNPEYIDSYVEKHKELLNTKFFNGYTHEDIKKAIYEEACKFEHFIIELCTNTINGKKPDLDQHFHDLEKNSTDYPQIRQKIYGKRPNSIPPSLLRIYAVKIESNVYVITGGAIKLVHEMHESEDTAKELERLNNAQRELNIKGITDIDGLYILEA